MILRCEKLTSLPLASWALAGEPTVDICWWEHQGRVDWRANWLALSDQEREQAETFRFERDAIAFAAGRHLRRLALSTFTGIAALELPFTKGEWGKPALITPPGELPTVFNVANTPGLAVIAISRDCEAVGIDAEPQTAVIEMQTMSLFCSSAEIEALSTLAGGEHRQLLLSYWVLKESFLKAKGTGLVDELNRITVRCDPEARTIRVDDSRNEKEGWHHCLLVTPGGHLVAVSAKRGCAAGIRLRQRQSRDPEARQ